MGTWSLRDNQRRRQLEPKTLRLWCLGLNEPFLHRDASSRVIRFKCERLWSGIIRMYTTHHKHTSNIHASLHGYTVSCPPGTEERTRKPKSTRTKVSVQVCKEICNQPKKVQTYTRVPKPRGLTGGRSGVGARARCFAVNPFQGAGSRFGQSMLVFSPIVSVLGFSTSLREVT